jgi:DNA polymerase-3 subunit delta'
MFGIDKKYDSVPWLEAPKAQFMDLLASGRVPHALLIQGMPGMGRRQLALWLATQILGTDPTAAVGEAKDEQEAGHPDFYPITILPDKTRILVDQIRGLISALTLTSYGPGGKVAIIYPADKMNVNAANSLLKTLEEPPGKTTVILISESLRRLPATIVSRCQRLRLTAPPQSMALDWLCAQAADTRFENLLDFAGGAPLHALALHEQDFASRANGYAADLKQLEQRAVSPVVVAERWKKEPELALQWLYWRLSRRVRTALEALSAKGSASAGAARTTPERLHNSLQASFQQMAQIRELRRVISGGISAELNLAALLMNWYGGLGEGT